MISRAASRTSSERPSATSLRPSINAFSFSRVLSDAGILSIGVLLRRGRSPNRTSLGFAYQARVHPNPFSSNLRTSPSVGLLRTRVIVEDADRRHSVVWRIDYIVGPKARDI